MEIYGGHPRFQFGGFWFGFMDPWPEYWSDDWYDNDNGYVLYSNGGYYLYNRKYPRDRIAIAVYLNWQGIKTLGADFEVFLQGIS